MAISTNSAPSLIPTTQPSSEQVKAITLQLQTLANDPQAPPGSRAVARAINALQNQANLVMNALRRPIPLPDDFQLTDPAGNEVIFLGVQSGSNFVHSGLRVFIPGLVEAAWVGVRAEMPLPVTATSNAGPDVVSVAAHPYVNGDTLFISGATGDTAINGLRIVESAAAGTFQLTDLLGTPVNGNGAYGGGGTAQRYYGGGFFETVGIGGVDMAHAKIRAFADGRLVINGATITLVGTGPGSATITLDPVLGQIVIAANDGSATITENAQGILIALSSGLTTTLFDGIGFAKGTDLSRLTQLRLNIQSLTGRVQIVPTQITLSDAGSVVTFEADNNGNVSALAYYIGGTQIIDAARNASFQTMHSTGSASASAFINNAGNGGISSIGVVDGSNHSTGGVPGQTITLPYMKTATVSGTLTFTGGLLTGHT